MPSAVTLIRSSRLAAAPYAAAATAPAHARLIFLAGACPLDEGGQTLGVGDFAAQATQAMANAQIALEEAGAGLADVISTRVLVASADQANLRTVWEVVHACFGEHDVPSTLIGVAALGYPNQLVELEVVAAVVDDRA